MAELDERLELQETAPRKAETTFVDALTEWWVTNAAEPYLSLKNNIIVRLDPIPWRFLEEVVFLNVTLDIQLLERLAELYAAFGWGAVEKIEHELDKFPQATRPTKEFLRLTMNVLAVMVAYGLVEMEQQVTAFASRKWTEAREQLEEYRSAFSVIMHHHYVLNNRRAAAELVELCRCYALEARRAYSLQTRIDERRRKDRGDPKTQKEGSGWALWLEVYAQPQREALNIMARYFERITEICPAAAFVLDELPDSVLKDQTSYDKAVACADLENKIGSRLEYLIAAIQLRENTLSLPGATAQFLTLVNLADFSLLRELRLENGGFEQLVIVSAAGGKQKLGNSEQKHDGDVNGLLADLDLLASFYNEAIDPGTWPQVITCQYYNRLLRKLKDEKQRQQSSDEFFGRVGQAAAVLGLLAAMLSVSALGAAAGSRLVTLFTACRTTSAILNVVTAFYDLYAKVQKAGNLVEKAEDSFFRLAQKDPEAMHQIGELLSRSAGLQEAVRTGGLLLLLTMGLAKLETVAMALDFQGYFQDVESLFSPVIADETD